MRTTKMLFFTQYYKIDIFEVSCMFASVWVQKVWLYYDVTTIYVLSYCTGPLSLKSSFSPRALAVETAREEKRASLEVLESKVKRARQDGGETKEYRLVYRVMKGRFLLSIYNQLWVICREKVAVDKSPEPKFLKLLILSNSSYVFNRTGLEI